MKKTIWSRLIVCFLLAGVMVFLLLNTYGMQLLERRLKDVKKDQLLDEAKLIASEYISNFYDDKMSLENLTIQLKSIDTFLGIRVWIVNNDGIIIADSSYSRNAKDKSVYDINPSLLDNTFTENVYQEEAFFQPMLSLTYPINYNFRSRGVAVSYMAGELSKLDDYQKKFVANISHDFRSPLTSIKGYAAAILDGTIPHEMQDKYLNIILFETERLTKLTTGLLELNSFENNGTFLDITTFDINHIIKKTAEAFEGACREKKITLNLVFSSKQYLVEADMGKIQQVLYNLLDNAIKFSHNNSKIKISTEEKGEKVFVSVKDYGIGIPKDSIKKVWERFYKTDSSRGKDKKGTGLGLSITREIIQAHNENINLISTEAYADASDGSVAQSGKSEL